MYVIYYVRAHSHLAGKTRMDPQEYHTAAYTLLNLTVFLLKINRLFACSIILESDNTTAARYVAGNQVQPNAMFTGLVSTRTDPLLKYFVS